MGEQTVAVKMNMEGKSVVIAYLLWWFLGWAGVHRFYLGHVKTGIAQLLMVVLGMVLTVIFVGYLILLCWFVWWVLDAYFTYKYVEEENQKLGVNASTVSVTRSGDLHNELDQLERLHALYEKGVISQEQYEAKKATLI